MTNSFFHQHNGGIPSKESRDFESDGAITVFTTCTDTLIVEHVIVLVKHESPGIVMHQTRKDKGQQHANRRRKVQAGWQEDAMFEQFVDCQVPLSSPKLRGGSTGKQGVVEDGLGVETFEIL